MKTRTPAEVIALAEDNGAAKADLSQNHLGRLTVLSILAGAYIALGATLSVISGYGFGDLSRDYPALQKLVSGATFPIGLILVVVLGAELFTGNNAMLIPSFMARRHSLAAVVRNWTLVWLGNFAGVLLVVWLLVWIPGLLSKGHYHDAIVGIAEAKAALPWHVVVAKGIGANWCVCLAVWLAMSGHNLVEKVIGCWFPVMAFVVIGYEHSVANMFYIPAGMLEGADVGIWQMFWNNLVPATVGNIIGGALFVGCAYAWVNRRRA